MQSRSRFPYHIAVAIVSALAFTFAAAVQSGSAYSAAAAETAHTQRLVTDLVAPSADLSAN